MKYKLRIILIGTASIALVSCKTLDPVKTSQPEGLLAEQGNLVSVFDVRTGDRRLLGVDKDGMLFPAERCTIGKPSAEDYAENRELEKMATRFDRRDFAYGTKPCVGTPPNKGQILDLSTSTILMIKNPPGCWFCYLECTPNNVCNQICYPYGCANN